MSENSRSVDSAPNHCTLRTILHLRPHHLLCLQTFVGHGYSEDFVAQMTLVKKRLSQNPSAPIRLAAGADDLCEHCPNCESGHCTSDKPALFDSLVMEKLKNLGISSLPQSDSGSVSEMKENSSPLTGIPDCLRMSTSLLDECCPGCEWQELCRKVYSNAI